MGASGNSDGRFGSDRRDKDREYGRWEREATATLCRQRLRVKIGPTGGARVAAKHTRRSAQDS